MSQRRKEKKPSKKSRKKKSKSNARLLGSRSILTRNNPRKRGKKPRTSLQSQPVPIFDPSSAAAQPAAKASAPPVDYELPDPSAPSAPPMDYDSEIESDPERFPDRGEKDEEDFVDPLGPPKPPPKPKGLLSRLLGASTPPPSDEEPVPRATRAPPIPPRRDSLPEPEDKMAAFGSDGSGSDFDDDLEDHPYLKIGQPDEESVEEPSPIQGIRDFLIGKPPPPRRPKLQTSGVAPPPRVKPARRSSLAARTRKAVQGLADLLGVRPAPEGWTAEEILQFAEDEGWARPPSTWVRPQEAVQQDLMEAKQYLEDKGYFVVFVKERNRWVVTAKPPPEDDWELEDMYRLNLRF